MVTDVRASNLSVFLVSSAINRDGPYVRDRLHSLTFDVSMYEYMKHLYEFLICLKICRCCLGGRKYIEGLASQVLAVAHFPWKFLPPAHAAQ
jgi:hypothetical protein